MSSYENQPEVGVNTCQLVKSRHDRCLCLARFDHPDDSHDDAVVIKSASHEAPIGQWNLDRRLSVHVHAVVNDEALFRRTEVTNISAV